MRPLVLDARAGLMPEPKQSSESVLSYYKTLLRELAKRGRTLQPGEDLLNGDIIYPWWQGSKNSTLRACEQERLAQQYKQLSYYLMLVNLPLHQDEHSIEFLRLVLGDEDFEIEMQSQQTAKAALKTRAFDDFSVQQFANRMRNRQDPVYQRENAHLVGTNAATNFYCAADTVDMGRRPMFYVFYDPANGGENSDHVVVVLMTRTELRPEAITLLRASAANRNFQTMQRICNYLHVPDVMVRLSFQIICVTHLFAVKLVDLGTKFFDCFGGGGRRPTSKNKFQTKFCHIQTLDRVLKLVNRWVLRKIAPRSTVLPLVVTQDHHRAQKRVQPHQRKRAHKQMSCVKPSHICWNSFAISKNGFEGVRQNLKNQLAAVWVLFAQGLPVGRLQRLFKLGFSKV